MRAAGFGSEMYPVKPSRAFADSKFTFCSIAHATRADPAQLRARAQPNAVGHAEPALVLGLGAAR